MGVPWLSATGGERLEPIVRCHAKAHVLADKSPERPADRWPEEPTKLHVKPDLLIRHLFAYNEVRREDSLPGGISFRRHSTLILILVTVFISFLALGKASLHVLFEQIGSADHQEFQETISSVGPKEGTSQNRFKTPKDL